MLYTGIAREAVKSEQNHLPFAVLHQQHIIVHACAEVNIR